MTVLEKCARAICKESGAEPDATHSHPLHGSYWTDEGEPHWKGYVDHARAVLLALREPSEGMMIGARDWSYAKYGKPIGNDAATGCFQAMIDFALAEKPE